MAAARRVVLDTNIAVSALLFGSGPAGRVRAAWQSGRVVPLASRATAGVVTGDRALLALVGSRGLCPAMTLDAFLASL